MDKKKKKRVEKETGWERWSDRGIGARRKRWRDRKENRMWMEGWIRKKQRMEVNRGEIRRRR